MGAAKLVVVKARGSAELVAVKVKDSAEPVKVRDNAVVVKVNAEPEVDKVPAAVDRARRANDRAIKSVAATGHSMRNSRKAQRCRILFSFTTLIANSSPPTASSKQSIRSSWVGV